MDDKKLNDEEMSAVSGGLSVGETLDYALKQGKKVATVLSDTVGKVIRKEEE